MVSPPRRATHAAAAEAGPACARPTPAHEAPAAQPAYWLAQRAAPADLASRPRTAPRAPPAVGQRLLDARCMLLLLPPPPPRIPSSGREPPRASKTRDWLRPPLKSTYGSVSFISTKDSPTFSTRRIPPNACEHMYRFRRPADRMRPRVPLSDRMSCLETEYINQKYTHTFRHAECSRPPRLLAPLVHETPSVWAHIRGPFS